MKKNLKLFLLVIIVSTIILNEYFLIKKNMFDEKADDLINISELSKDFMDNYFKELNNVQSDEEKENMLIVISKNKIENSYGAKNIIEAPNNQYILQYNSSESKNTALSKLKADDSIYSVEENIIYTINETTSNSEYNSWGIEKMSLDYAINSSDVNFLDDITVAIIDSGCDINLFNKYYNGKIISTYDVLENSTINMSDENGHGTHIAGTIAEGTPSNVKILPIKVLKTSTIYGTDVIAAINYITYDKKADVINMSLCSYSYSKSLEQTIDAANEKNIISVAGAGNDNINKTCYPAGQNNTISIASVTSNLEKSTFSNYGSYITFAAPGTKIKSIMSKDTILSKKFGNNEDDDHETISGTSMATPHAVNAVAILKSYNKDLTLDNIIELLKLNAIDLGEESWDQYFGYGFISFDNVQFCDNNYCDEYGVYKDQNKNITNIELVELNLTKYNYYSLTNLMGSRIKAYFFDGTTEEFLLGELPDLEVLNYVPTEQNKQTVTIKTGTISIDIDVTNPSDYESGWEYNVLENGKIELAGYKSHGLNINRLYIPEIIDSNKVVSFAENVKFNEFGNDFSSYNYLYLPSDFDRIGNYSLSETNIKFIYGDSSGVEVGSHALESSAIVTFDIPITKIEDNAFKDAYDLYYVNVSSGVSDIGDYAFYNCKKLVRVNNLNDITDHYVERVGKYAFYNCISLSKFELDIYGDIEESAFYNCFDLTTIELGNVNSIAKYAFYDSGISEVNFGTNLKVIEESSFENCSNLNLVKINKGRIESRAFWNTNIEYVYIYSLVEYIAEDAFAYSPIKKIAGYANGVATYSAINDLGIVENATNKLIVGSTNAVGASNTNIPAYITEIGNYAFTGNNSLQNITIPDNVVKIGDYAFKDCYQLSNVYILGNSIEFGNDTFTRTYEGDIKDSDLILYVHKDSDVKQYAIANSLKYRHIEPDEIEVTDDINNYEALKSVDLNKISVKLIYHENEDREEILSQLDNSIVAPISNGVGFYISYQNGDTLQFGDTYYIVNAKNVLGYEVSKKVDVEVVKAIPNYTIPTNLTAELFQKLSEIELPSGFEWMNGDEIIINSGVYQYKAKYIPTDTNNYEIVENIDISINVTESREIVEPNIEISDKVYDGTNEISFSNINISNIDSSEYSIVSATSSSADVGDRTAKIKLKLTDEKFAEYAFDNGKQEKEFDVEFKIIPKKIPKPIQPDYGYNYTGEEITFEIPEYDENTMIVSGNKGTNAGKYEVTISLKSQNYTWEDGTSADVLINFEIFKANLYVKDSSSNVTVKYDGKPHSIKMSLEYNSGTILKYMDENNEYTLDKLPEYTSVGTYTTKYKLYLDENHTEYFGERTLSITVNTITNNSSDYEGIYDGNEHSININVLPSNYSIKYSINNTNYDLTELPTFKEVGEYTVNYKISAEGYEELIGSNKVKIYGIKKFDSSIILKNDTLVIQDSSFDSISNKITTYSTSSEYSHYDNNNQKVNSDTLKTGDIIKIILNNTETYEYHISILGDTSGDGKINYLDYVNVYNHIQKVKHPELNKKLLENEYLLAADMSGDGKISYLDYVKIYNRIKELKGGAN